MMIFRYLLYSSLAIMISCADHSQNHLVDEVPGTLTGKVTRISDGDTFHMLLADKRSIKIRLFGIDCPEAKQPFYQQAKNELAKLIFNKTITISSTKKDQYGRYLAIAFVNGQSVNESMLMSGMAWHFTRYDHDRKWKALEQQARKNRIGIWSQPNQVAPWKFRKQR